MIIVGNWKTYIKTEEEAKQLAEKITLIPNTTVIICPSSVHIPVVSKTLKDKGVGLGAQRISTGENSADTGGLSAEQLNDFNIERVIIGHSERRDKGVTDEDVVHMTCYALKNNLFPIICVSNLQQVNSCLEGMKKEGCLLDIKKCIIAYEPIEYIGADAPMKSEDILNETVNIRLMIQKSYHRTYSCTIWRICIFN